MIDVTQPSADRSPDAARTAQPAAGYDLGDEIGRGGMGVVYRARDRGLDREVAVKLLLERYAPTSGTAARFLDEARITGRLQHPGIPAVYQVGTWGDGRPFLAMKLIKGQTLDALLTAEGHGPTRWLGAFESICHAVGYAHSRAVIHRDLKPQNVMVGSFGEVQVMDWGLAKVLVPGGEPSAQPQPAASVATFAASEIRPLRDSDGTLTQAGSVLGTPAYMPPEQAAGETDKIDRRADVFGLGSILCMMLTGKPPYEGVSAESVRLDAMRGKTDAAFRRLDECGAEPDVVSLCKRCLAFEPADRPADADAVAKEIARIRAAADDRARQAELAQTRAEVQVAEQRKRRRVIEWAAAAVAVVFAGGLTAALWQAKVATREAFDAEVARDDAVKERERADAARIAADAQRTRADARLGVAADAIARTITRVGEPLWATRPELQAERRATLESAIAFLNGLGEEDRKAPAVRAQLARAHLLLAAALMALSEYDRSETVLATAGALFDGLVAEFPRDPVYHRGRIEVIVFQGHTAALRGKTADALATYERAHKLAEETVALDPVSEESQVTLADIKSSLAQFFSFQNPGRSAVYHAEALKIGEALRASRPTSYRGTLVVLTSLVNLGAADTSTGRLRDALARFDRAGALFEELDRLTPTSARAVELAGITRAALATNRGAVLFRTGKRDEGLAGVRDGLRQINQLLTIQPKSFPLRVHKLQYAVLFAEMLTRARRFTDAEAAFAEVEREQKALLRDTPTAAWLNEFGSMQRSNFLVEQARAGQTGAVERGAAELLAPGRGSASVPTIRYNVACAFAQLVEFGPADQREAHATRAVGLLAEVFAARYFAVPGNNAHLDADTDLDPLRERADFRAFMADVRKKHPLPPAVAPPPRPKPEK